MDRPPYPPSYVGGKPPCPPGAPPLYGFGAGAP
uniref:Uncharacterized protein n=1 Tax=Arundo donax TaxID=35708 RepID=A0A0A9G7R3_ARUDO